jgi:hypothetical protein
VERAEYLLESLAMILDDAYDSRQRRRLPGIEIVDHAAR